MKRIIGKTNVKENSLPRKLTIGDAKMTKKSFIAKNLKDFLVNISGGLESAIRNSEKTFQSFSPEIITVLNGTELTEEEFLNAFHSIKNDKSPGFDELHVNVIKPEFNEIKSPLIHVFKNPLDKGSSTKKMIIAKVTPIFKAGKKELVTNYKPISAIGNTDDATLRSYISSLKDKSNSFKLRLVAPTEVSKCIKTLHNDCSAGYDNIPVSFIKPVAEYLESPLTFIINNFIVTSTFPGIWKIARISLFQ